MPSLKPDLDSQLNLAEHQKRRLLALNCCPQTQSNRDNSSIYPPHVIKHPSPPSKIMILFRNYSLSRRMKRALTNGGSDKGVSAVVELVVVLPGFATLGGCFDTRGNYKWAPMGHGHSTRHSACTLLGPLARCALRTSSARGDGTDRRKVAYVR
jgi:hypothetical protein